MAGRFRDNELIPLLIVSQSMTLYRTTAAAAALDSLKIPQAHPGASDVVGSESEGVNLL